ncbi:MAG: DUF445 family protein [Pseudomonadota bacterium]
MQELEPFEEERLLRLRRIKVLATLVLVACFGVMVVAKLFEAGFPELAIIVAFAEAATIGGIADWYAVVALFRHPAGIPLPHTAIIPANQGRIANNLGRFFQKNFLARDQVERKLREINFAREMARWLADPDRSRNLAGFVSQLIPQILNTIDEDAMVRFASERVTGQLSKTDMAPAVGRLIHTFTSEGRPQVLLDEIIPVVRRYLDDPETLAVIRAKVQKELPVVFNVWRADSLVLNRLVRATAELLEEIKDDPAHPLRADFELFLRQYVKKVRRTKAFARRVEQVKRQVLARPELTGLAGQIWANLRAFILADLETNNPQIESQLAALFVDIGETLQDDPELSQDINEGMVVLLSNVVHDQRSNIAAYVADQVRSWDMDRLILLIELNAGRDLQFIRFNGMLIGGCVGLILFVIEHHVLSLI